MHIAFPQDRGFILGVVIAALVPAFALVHGVVGRYNDERQELAAEWAARGDRDRPRDPAAAVIDFQTALAYGADRDAELRLAEALNAAKRPAEARAHLLTLWSDEPGDGGINLQLARLAAAEGDLADAVRYYHGAIDGAWERDAAAARRGARLELARLLLSHGQRIRAQAELIALIDDLPADANLITEVGRLVLSAGAENRALALFQRALTLDPANAAAATLAGDVAFRAGDVRRAHDYLQQASDHGGLDPDARERLDISARVLALDPSSRGLSARARGQRTLRSLSIARARLARCQAAAGGASDPQIAALSARAHGAGSTRERVVERDPDIGDEIMQLVFDIERLPAAACGPDSLDDHALQYLSRARQGASR